MSTISDRERWDNIYSERINMPFPDPDPLLLQFTPPTRGGDTAPRALDLAGGFGQNALWLAEQGYVVDLLDISRVALTRAQTEASRRGLRTINYIPVDLRANFTLDPESYDLIAVFRFLNRELLARLRQSVRPGGRIIYESYNQNLLAQRPQFNPDYLLTPGELVAYFADWEVLHNVEAEHRSQIVTLKPEG